LDKGAGAAVLGLSGFRARYRPNLQIQAR